MTPQPPHNPKATPLGPASPASGQPAQPAQAPGSGGEKPVAKAQSLLSPRSPGVPPQAPAAGNSVKPHPAAKPQIAPAAHSRSPSMGKRAISIQDVAKLAGVSTATVSRVLNTPDLVAGDTATRVRAAIEQLGYKPNLFAKGLMTRKSRVLGIALPDIHGEFYSELLKGADDEARRQGYQLLVTSESRPDAPGSTLDLTFGIVDGLALMISEPNAELLRKALDTDLPLVVVDSEVSETQVDCILIDNVIGTVEATHHLRERTPHERLYFVGGSLNNFDTRRRADAFTQTLKGHNYDCRPEQLAFREYSESWGYEWASRMNSEGKLRGAAVLAANDEIALGVMQAASDAGLEIPRDLRLVGFDDSRLASVIRPKLSSVKVPMSDVGAGAVKLLLTRLAQPEISSRTLRLPTRLVPRQSST